jgi:hypothetical protein
MFISTSGVHVHAHAHVHVHVHVQVHVHIHVQSKRTFTCSFTSICTWTWTWIWTWNLKHKTWNGEKWTWTWAWTWNEHVQSTWTYSCLTACTWTSYNNINLITKINMYIVCDHVHVPVLLFGIINTFHFDLWTKSRWFVRHRNIWNKIYLLGKDISGGNKTFLFQYKNIWDETECFCLDIETSGMKKNLFLSISKHLWHIKTFCLDKETSSLNIETFGLYKEIA